MGDLKAMNRSICVTAEMVRSWLDRAASVLHEQRDYLTQLDAAIGDADHGANMDRGFAALAAQLGDVDDASPPGRLLKAAGETLMSTVGGASGALWGSALRRAGSDVGDVDQLDGEALLAALDGALAAIVQLGAAEVGDKTMVDALAPAVRALRAEIAAGRDLLAGLAAAETASKEGMTATIPLQAMKGRASYLGERSIGHQDPGATSTALIISALAHTVDTALHAA